MRTLAAGLLLLPVAVAARPPVTPTEFVRASTEQITAVLPADRAPTAAERDRIVALVRSITDVPAFAAAAIGPRWSTIPAAQQQEFVDVFGRLVAFAAIAKMGQYRAERVRYLTEEVDGARAVVHTLAEFEDVHVPVDYVLARSGDAWKVVDYRLAGVLSSESYRRQFDRALGHGTFADLLDRIRKKLAELGGGSGR